MRVLRYLLVSSTALIALVAVAVLLLAANSSGFVWLVQNGAKYIPGELNVDVPAGNLLTSIAADRVEYVYPPVRIEIHSLKARLSWPALGAGVVRIARIEAASLLIEVEESEEKEQTDGMPEVDLPIALDLVHGQFELFRIRGMGVDEELRNVTLSAAMRGTRLRVDSLRATVRNVTAELEGALRFTDDWPLDASLGWHFDGDKTISGSAVASGDLRQLRVSQNILLPDPLDIQAELRNVVTGLQFDATASWQQINWPVSDTSSLIAEEGQLELAGNLQAYTAKLKSSVTLPDVPTLDADVVAEGDLQQLKFNTVQVRTLNGVLDGTGSLDFAELGLQLDVAGRGIDLSLYREDIPLNVDFSAAVQAQLPDSFVVDVRRADARMEDLLISASGQIRWSAGELIANKLELNAADNHAHINGALFPAADVRFNVSAPFLDKVWPGLAGALKAEGRFAGNAQKPLVELEFNAQDLAWQTLRIESALGEVQINPRSLQLTLASQGLVLDGIAGRSLNVDVSGSRASFAFNANALGFPVDASIVGGGALDQSDTLRLALQTAEISQPLAGNWKLANEMDLAVQLPLAKKVFGMRATEHCWESAPAQICIDKAEYQTAGIQMAARLGSLPLERFNEWLGVDFSLQGEAQAAVVLAGAPDDLNGSFNFTLDGARILVSDAQTGTLETEFSEVRAEVLLNNGRLDLQAKARGDGDLNVEITGDMVWPVNANEDIHGVVNAGVDDFSAIAPLLSRFAGLENPTGKIKAAFTVEGTLGEPNVRGQATLANGSAEVPVAGIELTSINLGLTGQGVKPLQVSGSAMSGGGQVNVAGQIDWLAADNSVVRLHITGDRFQVVRFPLQTVYVSPDLRLRVTDELIEVNGRIEVPQANIEFDELPKTAVSPSSDIVVIREETVVKKRRGGLPIIAGIEVLLGKDVRFAAFGLDTKLAGSLRLQTALAEPEFAAEGNLRSVKGKFEAYGRELDIERGNLIFSGVIDNPRVDVRALRALRYDGQDVKVGVLLTGPIDAMQARVFGEPAMNESDALAYLVMNRPMRRTDNMGSEELSSAAVALGLVNMLPVTQQLSSSLGLDEVGVEGITESNSSVVAGKQFGEDFYIRYSYGLFDRIGTFIVRYNIGRGFSLEAGSGLEQTINMLYSIDR